MKIKKIVTGQIESTGGGIIKLTLSHTGVATVDLYDGFGLQGKHILSISVIANLSGDITFNPRLPFDALYAVVSAGNAFIYY